MITVTLRELDIATPALRKISRSSLSAKPAFQVAKILTVIDTELKNLDKVRYELFEKYSERDEDGKIKMDDSENIMVAKDKVEDFTKEFNELMATEVSLNILPLDLDLLLKIELTPTEAGSIFKFVNFE